MNKIILLFFIALFFPSTGIAETPSIKKNGYLYEKKENIRLRITGAKKQKNYNNIYLRENRRTGHGLNLCTIDDAPTIVHNAEKEYFDTKTYYTLKTSADGVTRIDCIYREGLFFTNARDYLPALLPYSVCNINKKLTATRLSYRLPEVGPSHDLRPSPYPSRTKIQEFEGVSLYLFFKKKYDDPANYVVQYKNKQIYLGQKDLYILGPYHEDKKGLFKILLPKNSSNNGVIEGIELAELKNKISNEGVPFDLKNPKITTENVVPYITFESHIECWLW